MANLPIIDTTRNTMETLALTRAFVTPDKTLGSKLDPDKLEAGAVERATIVMKQSPAPGQEVPAGTKVRLVMLPKDSVQVDDFIVDQSIKQAFEAQPATKVREEIAENTLVKEVFDKGSEYEKLTETEQKAVDAYLVEKGIITPDTPVEDKSKRYNDVGVLYVF